MNDDPHIDDLKLALLNRIVLSELWFNLTRGPTLAELTEAFSYLKGADSVAAKNRVQYALHCMRDDGWIESHKIAQPRLTYWRTTYEGRMKYVTTPDSALTRVPAFVNMALNPPDEQE